MSVASPSPRARGPSDGELDLPALGATLGARNGKFLRPTLLVGLLTFVVVQMITPRYSSEVARLHRGARQRLSASRCRQDTDPADRRRGSGHEPGADHSVARSRPRSDRQAQAGRSPEFDPALNGVSPIKAVLGLFGIVKDPLSMTPEERVLKAYYDRLTVTRSTNRASSTSIFCPQNPELAARSRQCHCRRLSGASAASQAGAGTSPPGNGLPAKSIPCVRKSKTPRPRSRISAPSPIFWSAPTTPLCRRSSWAMSTRSSPPRARKRPTPRPRPS